MYSSFQVFLWYYSHTLYSLPPHVLSLPAASPIQENISCFSHSFFEIHPQGRLTTACLKFASGSYQTRMFDYLSIKIYIYLLKSTFYKGIICKGQEVTILSRWFFKCVYYLTTVNKVFLVAQHSLGLIFVGKF